MLFDIGTAGVPAAAFPLCSRAGRGFAPRLCYHRWMRILVAPDKFKGSLGAAAVAANIAAGLRETLPDADIALQPIADGGEGTVAVIAAAAGGSWHSCEVQDAAGDLVMARYATIDEGKNAVLETSEAAGLWRIPTEHRDPMRASSHGVGELILATMRAGAREMIVGLGGSATNDGGLGMARALGFRFLAEAEELIGGPGDLLRLTRIAAPDSLRLPKITIAADVRNRLLGETGATRTFGRQKGAAPEQIETLEKALAKLADIVTRDLGCDFRDQAGAGAAGGLGFGLLSFCRAELRPGFEVVAEMIGLEEKIRGADIVITGEGRLDAQTLAGKAPAGVAKLARRWRKKVYAIVGQLEESTQILALFDGIAVLRTPQLSCADAMKNAPQLLRERASELGRRFR
ncbi:MAG TPA: glycerate kinase [Chthoniobacterales bacterium]|nr:glycerate kinase [Chthoniobacterales bacterium]